MSLQKKNSRSSPSDDPDREYGNEHHHEDGAALELLLTVVVSGSRHQNRRQEIRREHANGRQCPRGVLEELQNVERLKIDTPDPALIDAQVPDVSGYHETRDSSAFCGDVNGVVAVDHELQVVLQ